MRVLQLIPQTTLGGAETFAYTLGRELTLRGHEVMILANRSNGPLFDLERPEAMRVQALSRRSRWDPRILSFLIGSILRFRPHVLHSHNFEANTWARALGLLFPRLTVICHDHSGRKIHQPRHRIWIDRLLFRRCAAIFVVNDELGDLLRSRHRVPGRLVHVLPNGIDVGRFRPPLGHPRLPLGVVCVASLTDVKNHAGILRAWREVVRTHPDARLTLVGDGSLRATLEAQARRDGTASSVVFAGLQNDVRPALWANSVLVLFSHREALPLALLEGMAAELACVAPSVGGIPQVLSDGRTGRLVASGDEESLAHALIDLLGDPESLRMMALRAREEVAERFGLPTCIDRIEQTYKETAGNSLRRGPARAD